MNHTSTTKSSFRSVYRTIRRTLVAVISIAAVSAAFILPAAGCTSKNDSRFKSISLSYPEKNRIATLLECVSGTEYDCGNPDNEDLALIFTIDPLSGFWWMFQDENAEADRQVFLVDDETREYIPDPLNAFHYGTEHGRGGYVRYDGEAVDHLLRGVMNMEPTHNTKPRGLSENVEESSSESDSALLFYYYKGYYYIEIEDGFCGMLEGIGIKYDCVVSDGNDYHIRYIIPSYSYEDDEQGGTVTLPEETAYATLRRSMVNGSECWSIVRLSNKDYFDFSRYSSLQSDDNWKKLYINYIKQNEKENDSSEYALVYIDEDDVPELIMDTNIMADGGEVCTVRGDKVQSLPVWCYGISYIESENLFLESGGRMGEYFDTVYTIENGEYKRVGEGTYGLENGNDYEYEQVEDAEKDYVYRWNGKEVSKKQYKKNLKNAFDASLAVSPYDYVSDASEIIDMIRNGSLDVYPHQSL